MESETHVEVGLGSAGDGASGSDLRASWRVALERVNETFRSEYESRRAKTRGRVGTSLPVLIRIESELVLAYDGENVTWTINGERYHAIKTLCHLPAAAYLARASGACGAIAALDMRLDWMLREVYWDPDIRRAVEGLVSAVRSFLKGALETADLQSAVRPFLEPLFETAARLEIEALDVAVADLRMLLSGDLDALYVIVCAGHQPRYKNVSAMYFRSLLGERSGIGAAAESRVIYAENCHSVDAASELLAGLLTDRELGRALAGDPRTMQEDILGDAAARVLEVERPSAQATR